MALPHVAKETTSIKHDTLEQNASIFSYIKSMVERRASPACFSAHSWAKREESQTVEEASKWTANCCRGVWIIGVCFFRWLLPQPSKAGSIQGSGNRSEPVCLPTNRSELDSYSRAFELARYQWNLASIQHLSQIRFQAVMTTINQTWPHSDHIFLNNAQRASRLDDLTDASCSDIYTPHDVDLVLLDVASTLSSPAAVENIVRKYAATRSDPVVILFSQVQLCRGEGRRGGNWSEERYTFCSRNCLFDLNQTACGLLDPEPFPRQENLALDNERQHYQEIAVRYDHPHFNMHHLVLALLNDEAAIASAGASSKWELLSRLFMDHIHFQSCYGRAVQIKDGSYVASNHFSCLPDQGPLLLADVIVSWLVEMQHQSQQTQKTDQPSLKPHPSLPPPIHNSSDSHYSIRCYGFSYQQIVASVDKDHDPLRIKEATVGTRNFGGFVQKDSSLSASFNPLPPLNVTRSEGWRLLNYYKKKDGTAIFKPGLVTSKIGSILEIVIDTSFTTDLAAIQLPEVILSYTESYDGWGSVAITCVTNCLCDGGIIDAAGSLKQSVIRSQVFTVTQNRNCHIRIESRGGKFKISGVVVRVQKETMKNTAGKHKS